MDAILSCGILRSSEDTPPGRRTTATNRLRLRRDRDPGVPALGRGSREPGMVGGPTKREERQTPASPQALAHDPNRLVDVGYEYALLVHVG